jgi:hypothetical protein
MESDKGLTLEYLPVGRNGKAAVTVKLAGEVVEVESFELTNRKARASFVQAVTSKLPGVKAADVEAELLKAAADLASRPQGDGEPADFSNLPELDVSCIVRPERFITPEVSGLAVPSMTTMGDKVQGRSLLYLQWADGKRERRPMAPALDLPGGRRYWIHPIPSEPTANTPAGWSRAARQAWLKNEPCPAPVDVFKQLCERITYYIDLPAEHGPGILATLALWSILTYCYQAWPAVPYLYIGGPLSSGKSRVFEVLARLVFRRVGSSNMTAAALFRTLHAQGGTLLLDEAERLKETQAPEVQELLSMLLAGYKQGGQATRLEAVGDTFKTVAFDVYGPKALACIKGLPPALASRAIGITMFRAAPGSEQPRRRIDGDPAGWQRLRDDLHALALEHGPTWLELSNRVDVCPTMSGRDFELWQPLLALAWWLESLGAGGLLGLMQEHAAAAIGAGADEQVGDADELLLRILAERRLAGETPKAGEILAAAQVAEPTVFRTWTGKGVSNVLRRFGVQTSKTRAAREYRTTIADLRRIQDTYGLALGLVDEAQAAKEGMGQ